MTRRHTDYVYRDARDSLRVRVHRRENGRWDYDVFYPSGTVTTYSDEAGDNFATKRDALADAQRQHGPLRTIAVEGNVTPAAWHRGAPAHSARKKTGSQLDAEIADALQSRVTLTIDDTYLPWRTLQIRASVDGKQVGYLDLQLTPQGLPYPSMVSVDPAVRRRGVATLLYQEAARIAENRFGHPLHSDVDRSGPDDAFWQKQVREGRAECIRERKPPRAAPFEHIVKGRSGCVRYRLAKRVVPR